VSILSIGDNIKKTRKNANPKLTQEELAEKSGVSRSTIQLYEKGQGSPSTDTLIKLANALSVSISDLIYGDHPGFEERKKTVDRIYESIGITTKKTAKESLLKLDDFNNKVKEIIESTGMNENEFLDGLVNAGDLIKSIESKNGDAASLLNALEVIVKFAGVNYDENSEMYLLLKVLNDNAFPVLLDTLLEKNRIKK